MVVAVQPALIDRPLSVLNLKAPCGPVQACGCHSWFLVDESHINNETVRSVHTMKNPWLKKNPAMSMVMSAANAWMGAVRGHASNAIRRQIRATTKAAAAPTAKRRRKK
jgi:hypothetical protein